MKIFIYFYDGEYEELFLIHYKQRDLSSQLTAQIWGFYQIHHIRNRLYLGHKQGKYVFEPYYNMILSLFLKSCEMY